MAPAPVLGITVQISMLIGMAIALASAPAAIRIFSEELPIYWRNASAGHSPLAYYIAKNISSFYRIALNSLHFSAVYFVFARPVTEYLQMYIYTLMMFYGMYGLCHAVSMIARV